jgi:hypothetical protein
MTGKRWSWRKQPVDAGINQIMPESVFLKMLKRKVNLKRHTENNHSIPFMISVHQTALFHPDHPEVLSN